MFVYLLALACLFGQSGPDGADRWTVTGRHGAVVSVSPEATAVGLATLRRGGNAVDAAVATALALAVTFPQAGNIGGGGFMMVHWADSGETVTVEYRETAPAAATRQRCDQKLTWRSRGHLSVGVPGTVAGLALAHRRFGSLPWPELVEPAEKLAADGFVLGEPEARALNRALERAGPFPEFRRVFGNSDGGAWRAGQRLVQPDLARTLGLLRGGGPEAFYTGRIAERIVAEMRAGSGWITAADLAGYRAKLRQPVRGTYRGYEVFGPPPPSSGGITLVEMLNILENFDLAASGRRSARTVHLMAEAMRRAYLDRARFLGDPDFVTIPAHLTSKRYGRRLAAGIDLERATPSRQLGGELLTPAGREGASTTHFSIVDRWGNAVANTFTLQDSWGSMVVVRGAGFLLNNEMTDFNLHPGRTDERGRIGTEPNQVAPGKRMLSSQTPVIVLRDGKPFLITGSPGGRTIINTVLNVVTNVIDFGMDIRSAVDAPRMHHQWMPDVLRYERGRVGPGVESALRAMGHRLAVESSQGDAHSILIDPRTGLRHAAADRRRDGQAAGY